MKLRSPGKTLGLAKNAGRLRLHGQTLRGARGNPHGIGGFAVRIRESERIKPHESENGGNSESEGGEGECFESRHGSDLFL